jgi:very-short-patch-repair endonuclease
LARSAKSGEGMRYSDNDTRDRARAMRHTMAKAELILWTRLREANRHGFKFRRQHSIPPYIADFAHLRGQLVVEIDGATHSSDEERAYDARRTAFLKSRGWTVVRFTNADVYESVDGIVEYLTSRIGPHPARAVRSPTSPASRAR